MSLVETEVRFDLDEGRAYPPPDVLQFHFTTSEYDPKISFDADANGPFNLSGLLPDSPQYGILLVPFSFNVA